jgi:hypothetical protein
VEGGGWRVEGEVKRVNLTPYTSNPHPDPQVGTIVTLSGLVSTAHADDAMLAVHPPVW